MTRSIWACSHECNTADNGDGSSNTEMRL